MNKTDSFTKWESLDDYEMEFFSKYPEQIIEYKKGLIQDYNEKEINLDILFEAFEYIMKIELNIKDLKNQISINTAAVLKEIDRVARLQFPKPQTNMHEGVESTVAVRA
jgi:Zn-dependent M32 family carboxypeptidase